MRLDGRSTGSRAVRCVAVAAAALVVVAAGCGGGDDDGAEAPLPTGDQADDQELLDGRTIYTENCAQCHGIEGEGGTGLQLSDGAVAESLSLEEQIEVIADGRGQMPAWAGELSEGDIRAVARYEREVL